MICEDCEYKERHCISGQGFTKWTCEKCGEEFWHPNTAVPHVCPECSKQYNICENCGKAL